MAGSAAVETTRAGPRSPRGRRLKVFRTPIGFDDAYVAAPSRKAALEAWGSDADLFARGIAEEVRDEALTRDALAAPGKVIRRRRGTAAEHIAALGTGRRAGVRAESSAAKPDTTHAGTRHRPAPPPRPSRAALKAAEERLATLTARHNAALAELTARETALARERRSLEAAQSVERRQAEGVAEAARTAHGDALARWIEAQRD